MQIKFPRANLYQMMQLPNFCSLEEVKKKYRELTLILHPDRGGNTKAMQNLNSMYEILTGHKKEYDEFLRQLINPRPVFTQIIITSGWGNSTSTATNTGWYSF